MPASPDAARPDASSGAAGPDRRDLLVLRHAKAARSAEAGSDYERPLTRRGERDAARIARWMKAHELVPDLIVASPARRARETAEVVLDELALPAQAMRWDERAYDADVAMLLRVLGDAPAETRQILLVGHNPGLEDLVRHLGGATARDPSKGKFLPTCALARLRVGAPWTALRAGAEPVVEIVSWSRRKRRWKVRRGDEEHA